LSASPPPGPAADAPGPPPLPPPDLHARPLPFHLVPAGTVLLRVHRAAHGPLFFGPPPGGPPLGRWDAPGGEFGVCYLAEEGRIAFAETFLRHPGARVVAEAQLAGRSLARVLVRRELRLVAVHGPALARLGATAAVCSGPYAASRAWALALHGHPERADGIRYRARHDDDGFAVALFDRASDALLVLETSGLASAGCAGELGSWLDGYGVGLV
jgi:RES domain